MITKLDQKRIDAAKAKHARANAALTRAYEALRQAREALQRKHNPKIFTAEREVYAARAAITVAEMAAHGIKPMHTIILYHPRYTGLTAQNRFVVRITREGWAELLPAGKKGTIMANRAPQMSPYDWGKVIVTDKVLQP